MRFSVLLLFVLAWDMSPACLNAAEAGLEPARWIIKSELRTELSSEISAKIIRLPHRAGASFMKGDTLVQFDCSLLKAEQSKAAAKQSAAEIKVKHDSKLQEFKSVGTLEIALDQAAFDAAAAEYRISTLAVDRCNITAPFDGKVVQVMANEHQSVKAQQPLLEILQPSRLELEIMAPSDWLSWLKPGIPFVIKVDETGGEYTATVAAIGAAVDPVSKMILVRGKLDKPATALVPGMGAAAVFKKQ